MTDAHFSQLEKCTWKSQHFFTVEVFSRLSQGTMSDNISRFSADLRRLCRTTEQDCAELKRTAAGRPLAGGGIALNCA